MKRIAIICVVLITALTNSFAQVGIDDSIKVLEQSMEVHQKSINNIFSEIELLKLKKIRATIQSIGLPYYKSDEQVAHHDAFSLSYNEQHEQANWVVHVITKDILYGNVSRTNDFRLDPLVKTVTADSADYWDSGFDRGHLAPSADFRWSKEALSESYYYSNMSPQVAKFNRGKWADLEGLLRGYVSTHPKTQLYVVTGPLLNDSLPVIERSLHKMSVPKFYYKVVLDLKNESAIAFIMPNKELKYPISSYAVDINEVEEVTGINFFHKLEDGLEERLETQKEINVWVPEKQKGDVKPLYQPDLPIGVFNTVQAKRNMGTSKKMTIRGTVVGARKTRNGHLFFNLDKSYPNQIFTVAVWKKNVVNFSYDPLKEWKGKQITVTGKILDFDGVPTMAIEKESVVEIKKEGKSMFKVE